MKSLSDYEKSQKDSIEYRYKMEEMVMNLITTGNINEMKAFLEEEAQFNKQNTKVSRIPSDPLRDRKNGLVIRNTLFRIAAKNGGLPPLMLHHISEKYALLIERATSEDYLDNHLAREQLLDYTESVYSFSTITYSELIKNVVSFIVENLTNELSLRILAEHFHVHPAHLSRKFKQETNVTIMNYIHIHRVNHAKLLIQEGNTNILEVAYQSGFNSSSYFDKVFKKISDQTPSAYVKEAFRQAST